MENNTNLTVSDEIINQKEISEVVSNILDVPTEINSQKSDESFSDDDFTVLNRSRTKKKIAMIDSDSEDEKSETLKNTFDDQSEKKNNTINDSDSDEEAIANHQEIRKNKYLRRLVEPDSSEDEKFQTDIEEQSEEIRNESEKDNALFNNTDEENFDDTWKNKIADLCDPDTSDDDGGAQSNIVKQPKKVQKKTKEKVEKMTAKKALEQRKEILSESQRRIRESNISLPYHRPKPRSLREFLENRPNFSSVLKSIPKVGTPKIKMSTQELKIVAEKLKEREKELEKFYKSDSEEEGENDVEQPQDNNRQSISPEKQNDQPFVTEVEEKLPELDNIEVQETDNKTNEEKGDRSENPENVPEVDSMIGKEEAKSEDAVQSTCEVGNTFMKQNDSTQVQAFESNLMLENETQEKNLNEEIKCHTEDIITSPNKPTGCNIQILSNIVLKTSNETTNEEPEPEVTDKNYEFNLDDMEEESMDYTVFENTNQLSKVVTKTVSLDIQPRLSGGPNKMIDLENGVIFPNEITKLRERFLQHGLNTSKQKPKKKIDILNVLDGEIQKETLSLEMNDDEEEFVPLEKPGVRLKKLREELQEQMAKRRSDVWKAKTTANKTEKTEEDEPDEYNDDFLDDENEEDFTDSEEEEDLEENDCDMTEKRHKKSAFLEEEAAVSDDDINELDEELDEEEEEEVEEEISPTKRVLKRILNNMDESDEEDDNNKLDFLVPDQPSIFKTKQAEIAELKPDTEFTTPVSYVTGLANLNATVIKPQEATDISQTVSSPAISTQQLGEIFTDSIEDFTTQQIADICSGQFTDASVVQETTKKSENALDENDENIISQLIDEEELEKFKKKFESPFSKNDYMAEAKEVEGTGGIIQSDDEDDLQLMKRKKKRLNFVDDEEDEEPEVVHEEKLEVMEENDDIKDVQYDSEENEVEGDLKPVRSAHEFFENEAELSESEWGSDDEDEKDLDEMEEEKGDDEHFDEEMLRSNIEKVQMKQMLDDDNREVKLLQELLLEDGELHGSGRQRQFRWKNIDAVNDNEVTNNDGEVYLEEEDESEEQWRKSRHAREMFLLKKGMTPEEDSLLAESQNLSFTTKSLRIKSQIDIKVTNEKIVKRDHPLKLLNNRGSFLNRSEQILQKLAEHSKTSLGAKNVNRIVFQTVEEVEKKRKAPASDSTPVALKKIRLSGISPAVGKGRKLGKSLFGRQPS